MAATQRAVCDTADQANVKTSIFEKVSYGMGDVACNVVFALTSGLVTYFYTNVMSISAAMVGMIMLFSRLFDGISDVAIGLIMDKVHSKHGRGRAWVLWMALPYGVSAVALFCLPANATMVAQGIYIFITYNLCTTIVYTALNLPYAAMAPLMTRNEQDLSRINLFRMAMSPIGNMIVSAATLPIINRMGGDQAAWIKVTLIYSAVAILFLLWCFFGTKERVNTQAAQEAEKLPIGVRFSALVHNKYFLLILFSSLFLAVYQTVNGTCATYYSQYILGNNEYYGVLNLAENIPQVAVIMILAPFIKKFGKRNLVLAGALLTLAAQLTLLFVPANPVYVAVVAALRGVGKAPLFGCVFTMMADVVNYGHWKTGVRVQALIFSAATVGQKFGGGITGSVIGNLMDASGFTGLAEEIPSAVAMVQNLYIWGTIFAWAVIAALMFAYKLDKQYDGMMSEMAQKGMLKQAD
ncbi:MAG: glycoside-pentoside-hexuronide (GPH):cation symporter [Eubacteriales bacterium]|nr:glycoside-pentoside-hexuronide (GPH):cation symporter [Eubacteriales bacterium]